MTRMYKQIMKRKKKSKLTKLLLLLLEALAGLDTLLGLLGLSDGLLESDEPAIALGAGLGFERVLVAVELEVKGNGAVLGKIGGIGLGDC